MKNCKNWCCLMRYFFNFGEEIIYNTFDQNRFFIGINYRINETWTFDFRKHKNKDLPHYPIGGSE